MSKEQLAQKPLLRGYLHQEAFFVGLGACLLLILKSSTQTAFFASLIYSGGLLLMLSVSAFYHRIQWQTKTRSILKRIDHSAIFVLIAGTVTPIALIVLGGEVGRRLLMVIWTVALLGILQSIFWVSAPKWVTAVFYVITGWIIFPYLPLMIKILGPGNIALLLGGGIVYTVGAVFYALKRPNFFPGVFGYHELFHLFTIVGAGLHFMVIYQIIH